METMTLMNRVKTSLIFLALSISSASTLAGLPEGDRAFSEGAYSAALEEYMLVAENPNTTRDERGVAQNKISLILRLRGELNDMQKSALWAEKAFESGNPEGSIVWANFLSRGWGDVKTDPKKAASILKTLSDQNNPRAKMELAELYFEGVGVNKSAKMGMDLLNQSAQLGNSDAAVEAAKRYVTADGTKLDYDKALELYQKAADAQNIFAFRPLAAMYLSGLGTPGGKENLEKGIFYLRETYQRAYYQTDKDYAASTLGDHYYFGEGVPKDRKLACDWYTKAAIGESFEANWAKVSLAKCYYFGQGYTKDEKTAAYWLEKGAEANIGEAYYILGFIHHDGIAGYKKDVSMAAKMWQKGSDLNNTGSKFLLGSMYEDGTGVVRDYARAAELYLQAAERNDDDAQNRIGAKFAEGTGVAKDMVQALKWFTIAAARGNEKARDNRDNAERVMKQSDIHKAQKLAREWLAKNQK